MHVQLIYMHVVGRGLFELMNIHESAAVPPLLSQPGVCDGIPLTFDPASVHQGGCDALWRPPWSLFAQGCPRGLEKKATVTNNSR